MWIIAASSVYRLPSSVYAKDESQVLADPSTRKCAFEGRTGIGADLPTFKKLTALLTSVFQYLYPEIYVRIILLLVKLDIALPLAITESPHSRSHQPLWHKKDQHTDDCA